MHTNFKHLKNGCPSAFANIHAKYSRRIFWVGKQLINDDFVVESLVQDTFLKLWTHRDRIETPEHIFFFLRFVMKRACISYYTSPRNRFFKKINSLESHNSFQDYLAGYDPLLETENLAAQKTEQTNIERIKATLPLLNAEKQQLIQLCLKHGFQYKVISELMGISTTQAYNKIKMAITDIKAILHQGNSLEPKPSAEIESPSALTKRQTEIFELRGVKKYAFAQIAEGLNLSQKEVHREFMTAYKHMQTNNEQQPKWA